MMSSKFLDVLSTDAVQAAQAHYYGAAASVGAESAPQELGDDEMEFLRARDSFYLSTVNENGWPYVQHRGGPKGFLKVLDSRTLAFADYRGNRQLLSTGNLAVSDKATLFLMDYRHRTRLKILGHATVEDARRNQDLVAKLAEPSVRRVVERVFTISVVAFDWNCPQHITPRYTAPEIQEMVAPLQARIVELEARLRDAGK